MIGGGGGGGAVAGGAPAAPMTEVAKHNSKTDCWVVVDGQVLDVTSFLGEHPGGELAILTFAGKDATEEIHPPDVIGKYAPESVIGNVGSGVAAPVAGGAAPKAGGPDDFNGYGYFYVRLYWTGFGLPANIVEEYILLSVLLHVFVGLKRTWDMKLALVGSQGINVLNLAISGLMLLTFMTIHLFQFRFGDTDQFGPYYIRPPPYLINFWGILSLNLFWTDASYVEPVGVRDIYAAMATFPTSQAIVVGGGLGGMSAANTVVENGGRVVLLVAALERTARAAPMQQWEQLRTSTKTQKAKGIPDNAEIFTQDTMKGGAKKPELAKLLCVNSAADVDWLVEKFNLDLSLVARLGGHSQPRTHRGKERFPGMTITYALIQMLEKAWLTSACADAMELAQPFEAIGAKTIDLEWVQVHPTGLVKPDDSDAKIKFLAAEAHALRGVGGIILNSEGKRFCNELGRRLALVEVMKYYNSGDELAKDMGVPLAVIEESHEQHYQAAKKTEKDPDGGAYPAYPSGKSWDEPSGLTGSGKKFYHNIIPGSAVKSEPFYVAIITPVIHYTMGGLLIDTDSACIGSNNSAIPGLYAAGEVAGGVHGNNRLGGNSLLDCVVFGRVAGRAAAKYMLGADFKEVDLREVSGGGLTGAVESSKLAGGSYEDKMNSAPVPAAAAAAAPAANGGGGGFSLADVAKHNTKTDCWVVVDGQVLDVTSFLGEHPGGELAILTFAGKDATEEFNMRLGQLIHPPDVIGKYAPDSVIGMIGGGGGGGAVAGGAPAAGGGGGGISMAEVAKHNSKTDCWVT
eukprot:Skav219092  [mRNA]  locus=scaffold1574:118112:127411:+ [translate_table: standard]